MPTTRTAPQPDQVTETRTLPLQTRLMPVTSVDEAARTFTVCFTRGAQVRRFDWMSGRYYLEELVVDQSAVDMSRMEAGAPVLNTHQQWDLSAVLGVVQRGYIDPPPAKGQPAQGMADCLFSDRDATVDGYWRDVSKGIIRNVSVGYIVKRYEKIDPPQEGGLPVWRAVEWTPCEVSLVPIGADPEAGVRALGLGDNATLGDLAAAADPALRVERLQQLQQAQAQAVGNRSFPCQIVTRHAGDGNAARTAAEPAADQTTVSPTSTAPAVDLQPSAPQETRMPQTTSGAQQANAANNANPAAGSTAGTDAAVLAERQRSADIRQSVAIARRTSQGVQGLDEAFVEGLINSGTTIDAARSAIFAVLARHSQATGPQRSAANVQTVQDEQVQRRSDMMAAVLHRAVPGQQLPDTARRYRGFTLAELARRSLEEQGITTDGMNRSAIVSMAMNNSDDMGFRSLHGVSDFSVALANTVGRTLRMGYEGAPRTFTRWAKPGTLSDFRAATRVAVAGNLALSKVNEFGEFKRGQIKDAGESIQLATYGKIVGVTRQAVINDDLDFLSRIPMMFGRAAAELESDTVYGILTANAAMSDTVALFHANHKNLAGSGAVIGETSLGEARAALRKQVDHANAAQPLNLVGRFLLVPAAIETTAQKNLAMPVVASSAANTNVFQNSYEIVTEPRLDANSATAWYLVADNGQIDTVEYAYLEGQQGLYTETRVGFEVDGLEVKARNDFAAKAVDWRGIWKNPGA